MTSGGDFSLVSALLIGFARRVVTLFFLRERIPKDPARYFLKKTNVSLEGLLLEFLNMVHTSILRSLELLNLQISLPGSLIPPLDQLVSLCHSALGVQLSERKDGTSGLANGGYSCWSTSKDANVLTLSCLHDLHIRLLGFIPSTLILECRCKGSYAVQRDRMLKSQKFLISCT